MRTPPTGPQCQKDDWSTHKYSCKRQNYILKIDLHPRLITTPRITRTLSCPATATFATFHQVLQIAFDWATTHLYEFYVFDHSDGRGRENRLAGGEPLFKITELSTDDDELVMPGIPRLKKKDVTQIQLFNVLDDPKTKGKTIHYMYDFGDGW